MTLSIRRSARLGLASVFAIAAIAATSLSTSSADAADMAVAPRAPVAVAAPLWSGFYIGVHGGGGIANSRLQDPDFQITYFPAYIRATGYLAGGQVGANWQIGNIVVGGELDLSWANLKGNTIGDVFSPISPLSAKYNALATGTARIGYAMGNVLGYAKGGVAWANIDYTSAAGTPFPNDVNHQRSGLTAGAGVEVMLFGNLSAKAEYDYLYFGPDTISLGTRRTPSSLQHQLHIGKLGLNWRFGNDAVVARY
jgi:outer membrane immunogenic protein